MTNKESIELEGVIIESLPNTLFRVQLENNLVILAHLSGKMRLNHIKVLLGDKVQLVMSPYDLSKGRITRRL